MTGLTPPPHVIVLFGASGDLARRMLLPSLYHLHIEGLLPERWRLIGNARTSFSDDDFREFVRDAVDTFCSTAPTDGDWRAFAERLTYLSHQFTAEDPDPLARAVRAAEQDIGGSPQRLFYMAVPPSAFGVLTQALGPCGLTKRARVVYEKPFGTDQASFEQLNATVREVLEDWQIYTIDHFLGKETLQNVVALRFANGMFEPTWNRDHVDHVQIDVPEDLAIGTRAGFYEATGALRDMIVTHLFQVLAVVAMEPPVALESKPLIDEKVKVFDSMVPLSDRDVVRGQFDGYRNLDGVAADSGTETFVAARVFVDNWRWAGVPFYLRTGKRMAASRQAVTLAYREPPRRMFHTVEYDALPNDHLTLDMGGQGRQRDEGITLSFLAKRPGPRVELSPASMEFRYSGSFGSDLIGPYERLLHDALLGDRTLFTRADGIARTWELVRPVLDRPPALHGYPPGSWGPQAAWDLIAPRRWHLPDRTP